MFSASAVWGHGTERHFGTVINGAGGRTPQRTSEGSPAFTLLAIEATSNGILRALEADQPGEVREQASWLTELVADLHRRSEGLNCLECEHAAAPTEAIAAITLRIGAAAESADGPSLRREIGELKRLVASMQRFLHESTQQPRTRP